MTVEILMEDSKTGVQIKNEPMNKKRLLSPTGLTLDPLEKKLYLKLKPFFKPETTSSQRCENQTFLVAVSGGLDSVVLATILSRIASRLNIKLTVAHVNHNVRGKESAKDAFFVKKLSKKLGLKFKIKTLAKKNNHQSEDALRNFRYKELEKIKNSVGASKIFTAHHADDLLETRIMRLLQGTGLSGMVGMKFDSSQIILRPLLDIPLSDLTAYAIRQKLAWRVDQSNRDVRFFRNWVRHRFLKTLKEDYPAYFLNLGMSLQRIVDAVPPVSGAHCQTDFSRENPVKEVDAHHFLSQNAKGRVTSRHVKEFIKRLKGDRRIFTFRLAKTEWIVRENLVSPSK
jgi:tRNA(Ile)-lysidine synthetase-like protein